MEGQSQMVQANKFFPEIKGNFGFGCGRLPHRGKNVIYEIFSKMVDAFLESGFNYFDTAHGYLCGASEMAIGDCVSARYDRSEFVLTDKLTDPCFNREEDIQPFFEKQLNWCKVDYFDFYMMHAQDRNNYQKFTRCRAYETAVRLKSKGKIRHLGISFHDKADTLETILSEHPEVEVVQIQFNYADYDSLSVESRKVYEVCEKHSKPVLVMEPIKGGSLVNLPDEADKVLRSLKGGSNASYALRYAASFPQIAVVLSGMNDMAQMEDNIRTMKYFRPLDDSEMEAVRKVNEIFASMNLIPCTGCRYCVEESSCPKNICIPELLSAANQHKTFHNRNTDYYYHNILTGSGYGKASECIECGKCERVCPQHLSIRQLLGEVANAFEVVIQKESKKVL